VRCVVNAGCTAPAPAWHQTLRSFRRLPWQAVLQGDSLPPRPAPDAKPSKHKAYEGNVSTWHSLCSVVRVTVDCSHHRCT